MSDFATHIIRQYSKIDEKIVIGFLERNKDWTTKEVIKNATKYLNLNRIWKNENIEKDNFTNFNGNNLD